MSARETVTTTVRLPAALHAALVQLAELKYTSLNAEIVAASRAHVDTSTKRGN